MAKRLVVVSSDVDEARLCEVAEAMPDAEVKRAGSPAELTALAPEAEVIGGQVSLDLLAKATRLRWVHSWAADYFGLRR